MFDLNGKTAIVTGGTRGIGLASAAQLGRQGANIVVCGRKEEGAQSAEAELKDMGISALGVACNVGDKVQLEELVDRTVDAFGGVDILVCNAATNPYYGRTDGLPDDAFDKIMQVNVRSTMWLAGLVTPHMIKAGGGSMMMLSSIMGIMGAPGVAAYGISKAAEAQLARNLAVELGPKKIRVNAIAPGLIKTEFARALWENNELMKRQALTPLGRIGEPDDIAGVVGFLASDASKFITGQTIVADGGDTIAF